MISAAVFIGGVIAEEAVDVFHARPKDHILRIPPLREEIENGSYRLDIPVNIGMVVDFKAVYMVGSGRLVHTAEGFHLTGCGGKLDYIQSPKASYSLYSDYYWYEIGDVICIGDKDRLYYCFPRGGDVVAKTRMATEELYKLSHLRREKALAR